MIGVALGQINHPCKKGDICCIASAPTSLYTCLFWIIFTVCVEFMRNLLTAR